MKILIVSDTHGHEENLERVVEKVGKIDCLLHLGDVEGQEDYIEAFPVRYILLRETMTSFQNCQER